MRGGGPLPDTLYLQMDNCIRENKNTTLFTYVAWLVERGIFKTAYVSFLPVGHTHFDCDRLASRVAIAMKYRDVTSIAELCSLLKGCNSPTPGVDFIEAVTDVKGLFNPSKKGACPIALSRVYRLSGCATKVPPLHERQKVFMKDTSPLHWLLRRDLEKKVTIQSKLICDDEQWSEQHYPWTPDAPRPGGRTFTEKTSGLRPSDLRRAAQKPLSATRAEELTKSLKQVKHKLSREDWEETNKIWGIVKNDQQLDELPVPNQGLFMGEDDDPAVRERAEEEEEEGGELYARPLSRVFENTHQQAIDRVNRKNQGRASTALVIGNLVAISVNYTVETPDKERNDFWAAKITSLDFECRQLQVSYYHTGVIKNAGSKSHKAFYKAWKGKTRTEWVDIRRVLHTWEKFTERKSLIAAKDRRAISRALVLPDDDPASEPEAEESDELRDEEDEEELNDINDDEMEEEDWDDYGFGD